MSVELSVPDKTGCERRLPAASPIREGQAKLTWDDYIENAVIRAIDVVQEITGAKTINALGFCVGGTLLATALGVLAARGRQPAESLTLLTTFLDFSNTGVLDIFVNKW